MTRSSINRDEVKVRTGDVPFAKCEGFFGIGDRNEVEFSTLLFVILKTESTTNITTAPVSVRIVNTIKMWTSSHIDPTNTSFAQALKTERSF